MGRNEDIVPLTAASHDRLAKGNFPKLLTAAGGEASR